MSLTFDLTFHIIPNKRYRVYRFWWVGSSDTDLPCQQLRLHKIRKSCSPLKRLFILCNYVMENRPLPKSVLSDFRLFSLFWLSCKITDIFWIFSCHNCSVSALQRTSGNVTESTWWAEGRGRERETARSRTMSSVSQDSLKLSIQWWEMERNLRLLCLRGDDWSEVDSLQRGSALKAMGACEAHQAKTPGCSFPSCLIRVLLLLLPDVFSLNLFSCLCTAMIEWDSWDSWPCKPDCSFWLWCSPSGHFTAALGLCAEPFIRVAGLSHHGGLGVWSALQQVKRQ